MNMKGFGRNSLIEVLLKHLLGSSGEIYHKPVKIAGVPAEIRTECLPNTSLESYSKTSLFGFLRSMRILSK
jgi:hypothetical protein